MAKKRIKRGAGSARQPQRAETQLGERIREHRRALGLSLVQMTKKTGITAGALSQIERGKLNPSLRTLRSVARALDISLFQLFYDDAAEGSTYLLRRNERRRLHFADSTVTYESMSPLNNVSMEVMLVRMDGGNTATKTLNSHAGEEFVLVLRGQVRVDIGDKTYRLGAQDSIYFRSDRPHRYMNEKAETAEMIVAITPAGWH